jgi:hypothetical protein
MNLFIIGCLVSASVAVGTSGISCFSAARRLRERRELQRRIRELETRLDIASQV